MTLIDIRYYTVLSEESDRLESDIADLQRHRDAASTAQVKAAYDDDMAAVESRLADTIRRMLEIDRTILSQPDPCDRAILQLIRDGNTLEDVADKSGYAVRTVSRRLRALTL